MIQLLYWSVDNRLPVITENSTWATKPDDIQNQISWVQVKHLFKKYINMYV